jgi:MoaA/NifB/PqqE/SkfB family radical SAM enzyme
MENVRNLLAERARRKLHRPSIVQQFFLWKGNHARIGRAYDLALELGVDKLYMRDLSDLDRSQRMTREELQVARREVLALIERDRGRGLLEVDFSNERVFEQSVTKHLAYQQHKQLHRGLRHWSENMARTEYCYVGWYSTTIRGNGEVFPCCMLAASKGAKPLGNVNDRPVMEIWNGPSYRQLRDELHQIALSGGGYNQKKCHFTYELCSFADACPFVKILATPDFYREVHAELAAIRRRPMTQARLVAQALSQYRPFAP